MSTPNQIAANRVNALASTGPLTMEGVAASKANSTRHGLSSGFSLLPHEDQQEFNSLTETYRAEFTPKGEHQTFIVDQMVQARWRIQRIQRLEAVAFEMLLEPDNPNPENPDAKIVAGMIKQGGNVFALLQRYAASAERSYHTNLRELRRSNKDAKAEAKAREQANLAALEAYLSTPPLGLQETLQQFRAERAAAQAKAAAPTKPAPQTAPLKPGHHPVLGNLALRL